MHKLALLISVVVLTGCSAAHDPRVMEENPRTYAACYYMPNTAREWVAIDAQYHCQKYGRSAVRIGEQRCGVASQLVTFQCVQ